MVDFINPNASAKEKKRFIMFWGKEVCSNIEDRKQLFQSCLDSLNDPNYTDKITLGEK